MGAGLHLGNGVGVQNLTEQKPQNILSIQPPVIYYYDAYGRSTGQCNSHVTCEFAKKGSFAKGTNRNNRPHQ